MNIGSAATECCVRRLSLSAGYIGALQLSVGVTCACTYIYNRAPTLIAASVHTLNYYYYKYIVPIMRTVVT